MPPKKTKEKKVKKPVAKKQPKKGAAKSVEPKQPRQTQTPQTLRGMRDILPSEQKYWRFIYRKAEELALAYGYERIDTPLLEETALFTRTAGKQSDVVEKEMFSFVDKGGDNVSLRPEGTAPIARAYINHGMFTLPQPVKLFYWGSMFRYERPQHGRFREHHQFGAEVFGDANPVQDAEVILLAHLFYKELGIKTSVSINSLGCNSCRTPYLELLITYFRSKRSQICEDCKRRLTKSPLRLLDCKEPSCRSVKESAPVLLDSLDDDCKQHFTNVLEFLDDLQVPYVLNPHLVRGFDYYTRTVFEILPVTETEEGSHALGGGGRYDTLVEQMGGRATPACGFGIGIERIILQMKAQQIEPKETAKLDIFLAQLGDAARRKAIALFEELRTENIRASANFAKGTLKNQLEVAHRLGAKYALILGQKEILDGTVLIRDMESGMQEVVLFEKIMHEMKKKLGKQSN